MLSDGWLPETIEEYNTSLNAPYGARCFLTLRSSARIWVAIIRLNAPYGARCFLTQQDRVPHASREGGGLNAPYGARCFLTHRFATVVNRETRDRLNAPYGARCFLT